MSEDAFAFYFAMMKEMEEFEKMPEHAKTVLDTLGHVTGKGGTFGMVKGFTDERDKEIIIDNLLPALKEFVTELASSLDPTEVRFSDAELESLLRDSIRAQDVFTPFVGTRNQSVDEPIFERAKHLLLFRAISKNAKELDFGGSVGPFGPPELPEELREFNEQFDEAAAELKEAADRLTAGSEDIREAANALLGVSPVTIRDDGADTDTVIEFRSPGPHAEVVTVSLATAEVKAFIAEIDETMRPIKDDLATIFVDMRATVEEVFGAAQADWRGFGDTAAGALRDIAAAHGDVMGKIAQLLSPLGSLVFGGGGVEGGAGSGDPGGPSSGVQAPIRRYAEGGVAPAGLPALVGEAGPELFVPDIFADFGQPTAGLREVELPVIFTRSIDARGAAPGVEQAINRVLDDFERTFREHDAHEINAGLRRNGFNGRLKFA